MFAYQVLVKYEEKKILKICLLQLLYLEIEMACFLIFVCG